MKKEKSFFAEDIIKLRTKFGWSRKKLSDMTEVPYCTLKQWETGISQPARYVKIMFIMYINTFAKKIYENIDEETDK